MNLLKHIGIIRQNYNVSAEQSNSPKSSDNDSPSSSGCGGGRRLEKPPPRSPSALRLAALPTVPDIAEDPEAEYEDERRYRASKINTSSPEPEDDYSPTAAAGRRLSGLFPNRKKQTTSRLPEPTRCSSPPPASANPSSSGEESSSRKRRLTRRPSGLMTAPEPVGRPISPVLGSPMKDIINLSAEEEAEALQDVEDIAARQEEYEHESTLRKAKRRERERERIRNQAQKEEEESDAVKSESRAPRKEKKKSRDEPSEKLRDVTNSPRRRRGTADFSEGVFSSTFLLRMSLMPYIFPHQSFRHCL